MVPSFPNLVWDGTSPSRPDPGTFTPPTASDYQTLVAEVRAMQSFLLGSVDVSEFQLSLGPTIFSAGEAGTAVQIAPDGNAWKAVVGTGAVNGDTTLAFYVQQSMSESGSFETIAESTTLFD